MLVDVAKLITAYYTVIPDVWVPAQRVAFGTSGHRGSSLAASFNEAHILAITQAICEYRNNHGTTGPLFLGLDTHALSQPAGATVLEVLTANGVDVMLAPDDEYTPTPAISHAILTHNHRRTAGVADGIVVTPSHNPPDSGGLKYNPPDGGAAGQHITRWIESRANALLERGTTSIQRVPHPRALRAPTTHRHDYLSAYVADLENVIDMDVIRASGIRMGVDPLGGAGVHYWRRIAEHYKLDLTVVSEEIDATFRFMSLDWDGRIRMDPSSPYAMQRLLGLKGRFDVGFACDTDHDRHGIVTPTAGLLPANHYLTVAVDYLFQHRPQWPAQAAVGKTVVSTQLIDRVAARLGRRLFEVPVGFKWYSAGLLDATLGFACEESAGASFLRRDGRVWTTDKDGIAPALLAAEMTARQQHDPGELYAAIEAALGKCFADRVEARATPLQKSSLAALLPEQVVAQQLAGEPIERVLSHAPGNGAAIGGIKLASKNGWFAARPSGTEDIYKIYGESFRDEAHLRQILKEAQAIVDTAIAPPSASP